MSSWVAVGGWLWLWPLYFWEPVQSRERSHVGASHVGGSSSVIHHSPRATARLLIMLLREYHNMEFPPGTLDYVDGVVRCAHCHIFLLTCADLHRDQAATTICAKSSGWYRATTGPKKWSCLGCWRSGIARRTTQFDDIPRCCQKHWVPSHVAAIAFDTIATEALAIEDDATDIVPPAPPTWLPPATYAAPPPPHLQRRRLVTAQRVR